MKFLKLLFLSFSLTWCASEESFTVTPKTVDIPFLTPKIIVMGDTGTGASGQKKVGLAVSRFCELNNCDLGLLLGDNLYDTGVTGINDPKWKTHFETPYDLIKFTFYPVLGNHDYQGNEQAQVDYKSAKWYMPSRYYKLKFTTFSILAIDTNVFKQDQINWIEEQLKLGDVKIIYGHHPIYSYGSHGDTTYLITKLLPLMIRYGVPIYMSGHDHDKQVINKSGIIQIVSGAGAKLRPTAKGEGSLFAMSTLGFAYVEIVDSVIKFKFLDERLNVEYEAGFSL